MAMSMQDYSKFLQSGQTPASGNDPFDYNAFRSKISSMANQTRQVSGTALPQEVQTLYDKTQRGNVQERATGSAALSKYSADVASLQSQAEKSAEGLEMMGAGMEVYMKRLQSVQDFTNTEFQSATQNWDAAAQKADEYVQASRARVSEVLNELDKIHQEMGKDRDFSRAHALQAGAQAVLGSMKREERNILQQYGAGSPEYEQFTQSKGVALATMQSNIHANYQQFAEQANLTYLSATNEAMWKQNMYTSFQEQQHVEMLKYAGEAKYGYAMQKAQFDISVEQLRMQGMENWANWVVQTPDFSYDVMPLVTVLADVANSMDERRRAKYLAARAELYGTGIGGVSFMAPTTSSTSQSSTSKAKSSKTA